MKRRALAVLALETLALCAAAACAQGTSSAPRPNIVLILADDLGWKDVSYNGSGYATPNIDRLARAGMVFSQAYAAAPSCSPTRAALYTGCAPARLGITRAIRGRDYRAEGTVKEVGPKWPWPCMPYANGTHIPAGVPTFAERLRAAGYETAFLGKWHLGRLDQGPSKHGFEHESLVGAVGASPYFPPWQLEAPVEARPDEYLTDRVSDEAVAFLERAHERPFLLVVAHFAVHEPIQGKPELVKEFASSLDPAAAQHSAAYAALLCSLDQGVGRVLDALERAHLAESTLVVLTSDNGPLLERGEALTTVAPLRGGKLDLYEGGLRVPLVVLWPGHVEAGSSSAAPAVSMDLYPTLLAAAGLARASGEAPDGVDLLPLLEGGAAPARDPLCFFVPHRDAQCAIRAGDWKLIHWFRGQDQLFDLAHDVGEQHDLAPAQPERKQALEEQLLGWIHARGAALPEANPNFDLERMRQLPGEEDDE